MYDVRGFAFVGGVRSEFVVALSRFARQVYKINAPSLPLLSSFLPVLPFGTRTERGDSIRSTQNHLNQPPASKDVCATRLSWLIIYISFSGCYLDLSLNIECCVLGSFESFVCVLTFGAFN